MYLVYKITGMQMVFFASREHGFTGSLDHAARLQLPDAVRAVEHILSETPSASVTVRPASDF